MKLSVELNIISIGKYEENVERHSKKQFWKSHAMLSLWRASKREKLKRVKRIRGERRITCPSRW